MKHFLLAIALLSVTQSFSQVSTGTIRGKVVSAQGALEFAAVGLLKTEYATTTNATGYFEFKNIPRGKYQLRITYVGYENFQQEVIIRENESVTELNANMVELSARLKEVVVTGALKEVTKLQSVTSVDVYTTKYFERNPVTNLFDALGNINGLFADMDNGVSNTSDVQINGLEGNYTMLLIDGVPAMNGLAGYYALNALPMSMIDKLEIVKGASSSIYGSDAIAGVINIKTKKGTNAPRLSFNTYVDSKLNVNIDLTTTARLKRATGMFSFSGQGMPAKWDIDNDNFIDLPITYRASFYNKWSFTRPQNKVAFIYGRYLFEDRLGGEMNLKSKDRGSDSIYGEAIRTHQWQAGFQYQFPGKEKVLLIADYSEHRQTAFYGPVNFNGIQRTGFTQLNWTKKVDAINDLLIGVAYRLNYYKDNTTLSADTNIDGNLFNHIGGFFLEDELSFAVQHKLVIGTRFDYSSQSGPVFTPRINYKWNSKDETHAIRIGLGTGYRTPNLLNEGFGALNGSRTIYVAEKLKPEIALNATAGYNRVQSIKTGLLTIDVTGFYTYFINMVNPNYDKAPERIEYSNSKGGAMAGGFSIYSDFTFNYPLKVGVGFTYTHAFELEKNEDGETEKEIPPHVPPFVANFYLSYTFPAPQLSIDWTGNIVSPMKLVTVPNDYRSDRSRWFTIQNIQVTKKFRRGIELYLGIKNIFNFIQKEPLLRPFDPFNRNTGVNNPYNYRFDTTHGFMASEGIKGFVGLRYTFQ